MFVNHIQEACQEPYSHYEYVIEASYSTESSAYFPLKQDDDLARKPNCAAQKCLEEFLCKGGSFQHASLRIQQSQIQLLPGDSQGWVTSEVVAFKPFLLTSNSVSI